MSKEEQDSCSPVVPHIDCPHECSIPAGGHSPSLAGCENTWLQQLVTDYANANVRELKQLVDMLGLPDQKQVRALKRAIYQLIWKHANGHTTTLWQCTEEGKEYLKKNPETFMYAHDTVPLRDGDEEQDD